MDASQQIHDMIQTFELEMNPGRAVSRVLDILQVQNERADGLEKRIAELEKQQQRKEAQ